VRGCRTLSAFQARSPVRPEIGRTTGQFPAQWVDAHEPIMSFDQWSMAQRALVGRRNHGANVKKGSNTGTG
jgi:hypothetical protein